jgi:hypothetical protein
MTHPGVGPVTALATEVFLGNPLRFVDGKAVASYIAGCGKIGLNKKIRSSIISFVRLSCFRVILRGAEHSK